MTPNSKTPRSEGDLTLVTGGTGHLGRDIVRRLIEQDRRVRVFARAPGSDARVEWARGDLSTGDGLGDALRGVTNVINAATFSPIAQRGYVRFVDLFRTPHAVDVDGTRRLLDESARAGVRHFLHVSIVGLDPENSLPYNRVKLAGERLVRDSDLPWSVVHAAPFYYLLARLFSSMRWLPLWPLPNAVMQPVDTADVASHLVECADQRRLGVLEDIAGPQAMRLPEFAKEYLEARGVRRRLLGINVSAARAKQMGFVEGSGRKGRLTWQDWLARHDDEPKGHVRAVAKAPEHALF